jgi:hypothetical protein
MIRTALLAITLGLAALSTATFAFEEQKLPAAKRPGESAVAPAVGGQPSTRLVDPELPTPKLDSGTKIRVPGLGVIGVIPKMDFGLELLYGASQPKQIDSDRTEASGVMGRVRVPIK